jgi:hypothetical protein
MGIGACRGRPGSGSPQPIVVNTPLTFALAAARNADLCGRPVGFSARTAAASSKPGGTKNGMITARALAEAVEPPSSSVVAASSPVSVLPTNSAASSPKTVAVVSASPLSSTWKTGLWILVVSTRVIEPGLTRKASVAPLSPMRRTSLARMSSWVNTGLNVGAAATAPIRASLMSTSRLPVGVRNR